MHVEGWTMMLVRGGSVKIVWPPTPIKCVSEPSQQISG